MTAVVRALDELLGRAGALGSERRAILGITGAPGAGKSTLAGLLAARVPWAARLSMDGFHLPNAELERLGRRDRKGAIDTVDAYGYLATLRRLTAEGGHTLYVPEYDRSIHEPVAGRVAIDPSVRLVVTDGNYLLDAAEPWPAIRGELAEVWYVELGARVRHERLVARHVRFGRPEAEARRWVVEIDEANARRIRARRSAADLIVDMSAIGDLPDVRPRGERWGTS